MTATDTIAIRAPEDRFHTDLGWLDSWHSFSFGRHYDPSEVGFGLLLVNNDDIVAPGGGFPAHFHRDMEIVTWVLSGALAHRDSTGTDGIIRPGLAQRMSAGSGITHSEMNASSTEPVHFVQMWVLPDANGIEPGYEQRDLTDRLEAGGLVPVA
ncbi:MAG: pirin family protein, partial [Acidimicrobiales bacterium]